MQLHENDMIRLLKKYEEDKTMKTRDLIESELPPDSRVIGDLTPDERAAIFAEMESDVNNYDEDDEFDYDQDTIDDYLGDMTDSIKELGDYYARAAEMLDARRVRNKHVNYDM